MKPAILFILFVFAYLAGTTHTVRADGHRKARWHYVHLLQAKNVEKEDAIDIVDDSDDDYLTRKVVVPTRFLSAISSILFAASTAERSTNISHSAYPPSAPRDIVITQRTLRI